MTQGVQLSGTIRPLVPEKFELDIEWPYTPPVRSDCRLFKSGHSEVVAVQHPEPHGEFQFEHLEPGEYQRKACYAGDDEVKTFKFPITRKGLTKVEIYRNEIGNPPLDD
jgi:hypothetical protein